MEEFTKRGVEEHKGEYNVWYGKYGSTEGKYSHDRGKSGVNPETRCRTAKDTGKTKADTQSQPLLCYLFAQGRCHHGPECGFLHRIPDDLFEGAELVFFPALPPTCLLLATLTDLRPTLTGLRAGLAQRGWSSRRTALAASATVPMPTVWAASVTS